MITMGLYIYLDLIWMKTSLLTKDQKQNFLEKFS
jgi:hypothetical protein